MTTDTVPKIRSREIVLDGRTIRMTGIAKGAAMIGPNMATMLSVIMTDAAISAADAQRALAEAVVESFNCISVDGHMSTNDTVLLLANGAAGGEPVQGKVAQPPFGQRCSKCAKTLRNRSPPMAKGRRTSSLWKSTVVARDKRP